MAGEARSRERAAGEDYSLPDALTLRGLLLHRLVNGNTLRAWQKVAVWYHMRKISPQDFPFLRFAGGVAAPLCLKINTCIARLLLQRTPGSPHKARMRFKGSP